MKSSRTTFGQKRNENTVSVELELHPSPPPALQAFKSARKVLGRRLLILFLSVKNEKSIIATQEL